ncbi:CARDB domain-containing protein [Chromatium okenii]|uniref:InlB B-repeat-containing protein n=1 Tax=Chromatium okenii TaxID=61644 RepID=UPI0034E96577
MPAGINCGAICAADFNRGSEITLTAAPDANSTFSGWSGACTNKTGDCTVTMSEAQTVTATFIAKPITYKLSVSKVGDGSVKSDPTGINCGSDCVASFDKGKVVTLTATAATGYSFGGWSGACSNTSGTCSVSMASAKTVTATFIVAAPVTYKLTVTKTGSGSINSDPTGINCGSNCSANFESGSAVILTAEPASGYEFNRWSGCTAFATNPLQCQVDINKAQTVSATFTAAAPTTPVNYQLTVKKTGNGTINSDPNGINCGSNCSANFESGKTITLTAAPAADSTFVSWSGCTAVAANPLQCTVTMSKAQAITATFAVIPTTGGNLTVKTVGNGNVTSDPLGINCGSLCAASFSDRVVTLTALPASGETFVRWNGCIANATNPMQCRVTLTKTLTVTAEFSNKTTLEADIQITNVVLTPVSPSAGKIFTAQITLKNIGNIALTSGSHLEVWANEPTGQSCGAIGDAFADIDQLARNDSTTITVKLIAPIKGMQRLRVFADSQCKMTELSERNNQLVKHYTVN